jgi:hypothetical protein
MTRSAPIPRQKKKKEKTHLDNHVYIPQALQAHLGRHDLYPLPCVLGVVRRDTALADVLREQLVNQRKPLGDLLARAVVQQDGDLGAGRGDEGDAGAWQSMCQCGQGGGCEKEEELPIWPAPRTPSVLIPCAMDMLRLWFYLQLGVLLSFNWKSHGILATKVYASLGSPPSPDHTFLAANWKVGSTTC